MGAAKRPLEEDSLPDAQRHCADKASLTCVLEYQANTGRLTGIIRSSDALDAPPQCTVLFSGHGTEVTISHAKCRSLVADVPWTVTPGTYDTRTDHNAFTLSLTAARSSTHGAAAPTPWSAAPTRPPRKISCALCGSHVAVFSTPVRVRPLPADNWEELVDAWMCHGDQRLNRSVLQGREGVGASNTPHECDIWLGSVLCKVASIHMCGTTQGPVAERGPWEVRFIQRPRHGPAEG